MKRSIILLSIATILSIAYAIYQKTEAQRYMKLATANWELAAENAKMAAEQAAMAEAQRHRAEQEAMEAMRQNQLATAALEQCKKSR